MKTNETIEKYRFIQGMSVSPSGIVVKPASDECCNHVCRLINDCQGLADETKLRVTLIDKDGDGTDFFPRK